MKHIINNLLQYIVFTIIYLFILAVIIKHIGFFITIIFMSVIYYIGVYINGRIEKSEKSKKTSIPPLQKKDPYKEMGDKYEKYIGARFEELGNLVIYNGFIKGYEDKGVDIISISQNKQEINLVQCKNWRKKNMDIDDIKKIYEKLNNYGFDFLQIDILTIKYYLQYENNFNADEQFEHVLKYKLNYTIRKTLYASSDKVMDLNIGKFLTMIKPNIFRYKDMKIVIENSR